MAARTTSDRIAVNTRQPLSRADAGTLGQCRDYRDLFIDWGVRFAMSITVLQKYDWGQALFVLHLSPMGKRKEQHSKKRFETKDKNAPRDDHPGNVGTRGALSHALSSGWVQNSSVAFFVAIVGLVIAMATRSQIKAAVIGVASTATLAVWIIAIVFMKYAGESAFTITKRVLFMSATGEVATSGPFWIKYRSPMGDTLSPLPVSLYVVIQNEQGKALKVASLRVSMQAKGNKWLKLTHVDARVGEVYWLGNNPRQSRQLDNQNQMLDVVLSRPIPANSPVEGWLFFSTREHYPTPAGTQIRTKYVLTDSAGVTTEYTTPFEEVRSDASPDQGGAGENLPMHVGPAVDLSTCCPMQFWVGGIIPVPDKPN
jgi:hypothetical protein